MNEVEATVLLARSFTGLLLSTHNAEVDVMLATPTASAEVMCPRMMTAWSSLSSLYTLL